MIFSEIKSTFPYEKTSLSKHIAFFWIDIYIENNYTYQTIGLSNARMRSVPKASKRVFACIGRDLFIVLISVIP